MSDLKRKMGMDLSLLNLMVALPVLLAFSSQWLLVVLLVAVYWVLFRKKTFLEQFRQKFPQLNRPFWTVIIAGLVAAAIVSLLPNLRGLAAFVWLIIALTQILPIGIAISKMGK